MTPNSYVTMIAGGTITLLMQITRVHGKPDIYKINELNN